MMREAFMLFASKETSFNFPCMVMMKSRQRMEKREERKRSWIGDKYLKEILNALATVAQSMTAIRA